MANILRILIMAGIVTVALLETTNTKKPFPRCEFRLRGLPFPQGDTEDLPVDCYNYGASERKAWEKENDKFDEFNEKLQQTELNLLKANISFVMSDDETIQIVPKNYPDNMVSIIEDQPEKIDEEVEAMDFDFRQILHHHLKIFNKTGECQQWSEDVIAYCDCLIEVRNEMIACLNDLNTCFNIVIE